MSKTDSTIYTPERVMNARRNIERYDWARDIRDRAVESAGKFANLSDDFLWDLIAPQSIPRGIHVNMSLGCPNCGKEIERFGNYPWICDVINRPWKVECPSCHGIYPKNHFAAFYESGKDERGIFRYDRADRSLLFNTDHPAPDDPLHNYGVDDTMGWTDPDGNVYRFIGYYGHYGIWTAIKSALGAFRDAYIYTGDPVYARKAGLMLCRIAGFYPDMDWSYWAERGFTNSDGLSGCGKIWGRIWETDLVNCFCTTYDAVYPGLDDPQLQAYLASKTNSAPDPAALRELIENNILREVHDGILNRQIEGNEGMYQHSMAIAAVVLDEPGTSDEWLDWICADGDARYGNMNGGNMVRIFEQKIDEDGMGNEASPMYNGLWRGKFRAISDLLENYPRYKGVRIVDLPKYRKMFETPARLVCLGSYIPNIGDSLSTGAMNKGISPQDMAYAYRTFKDPWFARMAYFLNENKVDGIRSDIFDPDPDAIAREIEAAGAEHGSITPVTEEMPHYGLTILRSGSGDNQRALSLYYGRNTGHGHKDTLNIDLFGFGLSLLPDLGYPEFAYNWPSRYEWTQHTISHNSVVVDRRKQHDSIRGKSNFVIEGDGVSAAEVFADRVYLRTTLYQRTVALLDISERDFYVVDIFRVKGGSEHLYSLHGPEGEVDTEGLDLIAQPKGTLAGEDIPYGADLGGREEDWENSTGYQYLYDIRRDPHPSAQPAITYKVIDTWHVLEEPKDIRLRVNLISPPGEVILAHGDPPQNKVGNPRRLTYILSPNAAGESTFVSIIEPYIGSRCIERIDREDDGDTVTLTVKITSGRVDTIKSSLKPGRFSVISEENGRINEKLDVQY